MIAQQALPILLVRWVPQAKAINNQLHSFNQVLKLCRICSNEIVNGIEIFGTNGDDLCLLEKINLLMPLSINKNDKMSQKLCLDCYDKLESYYKFVILSIQTDINLRRFLNLDKSQCHDSKFNKIIQECASKDMNATYSINQTKQDNNVNSVQVENNHNLESNIKGNIELCVVNSQGNCDSEITNNFVQLTKTITNTHQYSFEVMNDISINRIEETTNLNLTQREKVNYFGPNMKIDTSLCANSQEDCDIKVIEDLLNKATEKRLDNLSNLDNTIICSYCKDSFKTQEIFENHKILCSRDDDLHSDTRFSDGNLDNAELDNIDFSLFICDYCDKTFTVKALFEKHKLLHECTETSIKQMINCDENVDNSVIEIKKRCDHCDADYQTKKELQTHLYESHNGQSLLLCGFCDKAFEKWESLEIHTATHRGTKFHLCDQCGKCFKDLNNLRGRKRIHLDESRKKSHECFICKKTFRSRFHLQEHTNQHLGKRPYACEVCGKTFCKSILLRQHKLTHSENKHVCSICNMAFNRKSNMEAHIKRHDKADGYTCSVCDLRFPSMSALKLHRKQHTESDIIESIKKKSNNQMIWQCKTCNKVYSKCSHLLSHQKVHDENKLTFECDKCGKNLSSRSTLLYHKRAKHSLERPHECQFCEKSFVSKDARLVHERKHTGERPYICEICNMHYRSSSNLSQHMKSHANVKPHVCQYCNKEFARKCSLTVHERIHTGVKPYSCPICGKSFTQKNDMFKHSKTHDKKSI